MPEMLILGEAYIIVSNRSGGKLVTRDKAIELSLTPINYKLIRALGKKLGQTVNYSTLASALWGTSKSLNTSFDSKSLKANMSTRVSRLNRQFHDKTFLLRIVNEENTGYRIEIENDEPLAPPIPAPSEEYDWKDYLINSAGHTMMTSRENMEKAVSLNQRFGKQFMDAVAKGLDTATYNRVKKMRVCAYTANLLFDPNGYFSDREAYNVNKGAFAKAIRALLQDKDFDLELIIQAPGSPGMTDAIEAGKLANSKLRNPMTAFYNSYFLLKQLISEDIVYNQAATEGRFKYYLSEISLPGSIMIVEYKDTGLEEWDRYDHVKIDLYSPGLDTTMERRSLCLFKDYDAENYAFYIDQYKYLKNKAMSLTKTKALEKDWKNTWDSLKETKGR